MGVGGGLERGVFELMCYLQRELRVGEDVADWEPDGVGGVSIGGGVCSCRDDMAVGETLEAKN